MNQFVFLVARRISSAQAGSTPASDYDYAHSSGSTQTTQNQGFPQSNARLVRNPFSRLGSCSLLTEIDCRVLYIALESTTRKAAFLVPFYDYWNLLVLLVVTQKSPHVLARVIKLITPYEFAFDFIGNVLATIIDLVALVPGHLNRRWRGGDHSTLHQVSHRRCSDLKRRQLTSFEIRHNQFSRTSPQLEQLHHHQNDVYRPRRLFLPNRKSLVTSQRIYLAPLRSRVSEINSTNRSGLWRMRLSIADRRRRWCNPLLPPGRLGLERRRSICPPIPPFRNPSLL